MTRKIVSLLIMVMLLCSSITVTSFADAAEFEELKDQIPEAVVLVEADNAECRMIEQMTDITVDIKLKDGRDVVNVPVERVESEDGETIALWLGYSFDEIDAQIKADMAEFQKEYHLGNSEEFLTNALTLLWGVDDMSKDLLAIFENYEIVINGIPEDADHEFEVETNTILITSTIVSELFDIAVELIGELLELKKDEIAELESFSDIVELINNLLVKYELVEPGKDIYDFVLEMYETDEITKAELVEAVAEMDAVLEYLQSEDYTGTVFAGVYLSCECPYTVEYEICHQYFKQIDGKMVLAGTVSYGPEDHFEGEAVDESSDYEYERYYYKGMSGDVIRASDYIQPVYKNETYEYVGSYDDWTVILPEYDDPLYWTDNYEFDTLDELYACDDWWTEYKYDEFILGSEEPLPGNDLITTGLVLRYELKEDGTTGEDTPIYSGVSGENDSADTGNISDKDNTQTGDDSNMMPVYIVMLIALSVMIAAIARRKSHLN